MLDLLEVAFQRERIRFERFDGKMATTARSKSLAQFRSDDSCVVLLCRCVSNYYLNLVFFSLYFFKKYN